MKGKVAFITGGASGIGRGMAAAFAEAGMRVVIADIDEAAARTAADEMRAGGGEAIAIRLDVTSAAGWQAAADAAVTAFGQIDLLCNNAGVGQGRLADGRPLLMTQMSEDLFRMVFDINVVGVFLGVRAIAPLMIARGGGAIVNTASMAGLIAPPGLSAYAASKYACLGLSESLRAELAPFGVNVSVLCPGGVKSNLVRTSAEQRAARVGAVEGPRAVLATTPATARKVMDADTVGRFVLEGIAANQFYILTHPEYRNLVAERFDAVLGSFGESAEPGHRDPEGLLTSSRNPAYASVTAGPAARSKI